MATGRGLGVEMSLEPRGGYLSIRACAEIRLQKNHSLDAPLIYNAVFAIHSFGRLASYLTLSKRIQNKGG